MILRKFMKHITDQNWFAVGLDVLVVITGIFLGMQVTEWNEARQKDEALQKYYLQILTDMDQITGDWQNSRDYFKKTRQHGAFALAALENNAKVDAKLLIDLYLATQLVVPAVYSSAYEEMSSIGLVSRIPDEKAKTLLSQMYSNTTTIITLKELNTSYRQKLRAHIDLSLREQMETQCGDTMIMDAYNYPRTKLPELCVIDFSQSDLEKQRQILDHYEGIQFDLRHHISVLDSVRWDIDFMLRYVAAAHQRVRALVQKEGNPS